MKVILINKIKPNFTKFIPHNNVGLLLSGKQTQNYSIIVYPDDDNPTLIEPSQYNDNISIQQHITKLLNIKPFTDTSYPSNNHTNNIQFNLDNITSDNFTFLSHNK